ncbi:MAG: SUKH-3 domain-containing protein [Aggregatilineales bacterium]
MYEFSKVTTEALKDAGWSDKYQFDTRKYERNHAVKGCTVPKVVLEFLTRYGGLTITTVLKVEKRPFLSELVLIPEYAAEGDYCDDWTGIAQVIGVNALHPIGDYADLMWLVMSDEGKVYGGFAQDILYMGYSGEDMIETLCTNKPSPKIAELPRNLWNPLW